MLWAVLSYVFHAFFVILFLVTVISPSDVLFTQEWIATQTGKKPQYITISNYNNDSDLPVWFNAGIWITFAGTLAFGLLSFFFAKTSKHTLRVIITSALHVICYIGYVYFRVATINYKSDKLRSLAVGGKEVQKTSANFTRGIAILITCFLSWLTSIMIEIFSKEGISSFNRQDDSISHKEAMIITKIADEDPVYNSVFGLSIASAYWKLNRKSVDTSSATKSIIISLGSGSIRSNQRERISYAASDATQDSTRV